MNHSCAGCCHAPESVPGRSAGARRRHRRRPQHSVTALIDYRWAFGLETGVTLTHVGANFDNANNSRKVEGYVLADLRASFPLSDRVEIYGRVENLTDETYVVARRPAGARPGHPRAVFMGLRWAF